MSKRILILGSAGMAGHVIYEYFSAQQSFLVESTARSAVNDSTFTLDATSDSKIREVLDITTPDIVINCIGALVSQAEQDPESAVRLNSLLPHYLSKLGNTLGFRLIHISTDCVFSGKKGNYIECDFRDGDTTYARTKAIGELVNNRDITIRTSIVGPELKSNGTGLMDWFLKQRSSVTGFSGVFWSGVTTLELAKAIHYAIDKGVTGLVHLCPNEKISKADLIRIFSKTWRRSIAINDDDSYVSDKSLVNTRNDWTFATADYEKMVVELKEWMERFPERYSHYI